MTLVLLLGLLAGQALGVEPACRELRERRDGLSSQAMQAEITLVMALRRQFCAKEEAAAEQAHAEAIQPSPEARSRDMPSLDDATYIRCRQRAEALLRRDHPVLYRNGRGFVFYTPAGASLARAADSLQPEMARTCPSSTPPTTPPATASPSSGPLPAPIPTPNPSPKREPPESGRSRESQRTR